MLELTDIYKSYKHNGNTIDVLKGINITINQGDTLAVIGASGVGKSTLLNIMGALEQPTGGQVKFRGRDIADIDESGLCNLRNKEIGFVFQTFNLLPRYSALENVMLPLVYAGVPKHDRVEKAMKVLEKVGLSDRVSHTPNELSGGQRQRVSIARALINNPAIILADEPTGNLDSKTSTDIMGLFQEIHQDGNTIILVTHEENIAHYAKRIIRLLDGRIESDQNNHE